MKISPEIAFEKVVEVKDDEKKQKRWLYLKSKVRDLHDGDLDHLTDALNSYIETANEFKDEFKIIECLQDNQLLSIEIIHERIWEVVKQII